MAEGFVELGATAVDHLTDKYWETGYDKVRDIRGRNGRNGQKENRRYKNRLPSPEGERGLGSAEREDSLERESLRSERILRQYENEPDDPRRKVDPRIEEKRRRDSVRSMSHADGYGYGGSRPRSQPPRSRYDDDDSDYDERDGQRYRGSGRGYDDDRSQPYGREVIETERYRGPPRPYDPRRMDSYQTRDGPYGAGAGAMAPYRRSQNDMTDVSRRPKSRGRSDRYDDRDRSYSRSRSRSRSKEHDGWRGKLDEVFDTSQTGLGAGLVGAVVGGLAGKEFGGRSKTRNRDMLIGAVVGGLGANAAENQWRDWQGKRKEKTDRHEERWEQKWDQRSRSNVR